MDVPTLVFGSLGIAATIVVGAFGVHATTPSEFWLARGLFYGGALILAVTVFVVQWTAGRPMTWQWVVGMGMTGFIIFAGLAACIGWVNRTEATLANGSTATPAPREFAPAPPTTAGPTSAPQVQQTPARPDQPVPPTPSVPSDEREKLRAPVVTFLDGRAWVNISVTYHTEPSDAPLLVATVGDPKRVSDIINAKVRGALLEILEPLLITEARSRRADLNQKISDRIRTDLKEIGITIDSVSLGEIDPVTD